MSTMEFAGNLLKKLAEAFNLDNLPSRVDARRESLNEIGENPQFKSGLDSITNRSQRDYIPHSVTDGTGEVEKVWDPNEPQTWDDSAPVRIRPDAVRELFNPQLQRQKPPLI